jgi:hypothetical protein
LEKQPSYSDSLGCLSTQYRLNDTDIVKVQVPIAEDGGHRFDIRGGAVGTFVIAAAASNSTQVEYDISIRSNSKDAFDNVFVNKEKDGHSSLVIDTPRFPASSSSCMRFDIVMYIPSNLKTLFVAGHAPTHVQFDPSNTVESLNQLRVSLLSMDSKSMILPHANLKAKKMILQVFEGWIVGDVAIVDSTTINTQNGAGAAHVRVHPAPGAEPAVLQTITGAGRSDIFYLSDHSLPHRQITSSHSSSQNGPVYLTYRNSGYSGKIALGSKSYSATGLERFQNATQPDDTNWTHWYGSERGEDTMIISSRGWTGLYF